MRSRRLGAALSVVLAVLTPASALADGTALWRSALVPGAGQAHQGHYQKAVLFAGTAVATGVGLVVTWVHYNQAVDRYRQEKRVYLSYPGRLDGGEVISQDEIDATFDSMSQAFDEADDRLVWRNTFLTAFIATYVLNLADVLISDPHDTDTAGRFEVETGGERVLVTARLRF